METPNPAGMVGDATGGQEFEDMLDHVSIQCADLAAATSFYDAVLAPLGGKRVIDFGQAIGYGTAP